MLIGNDCLYDVIIGDVIRGTSGPIAVSSRLRWLLSGRVPGSFEPKTYSKVTSNLILDTSVGRPAEENEELSQTLREFWKQESSGIDKGSEPTNETKQDEQFEITFNGKRCPVSLPLP